MSEEDFFIEELNIYVRSEFEPLVKEVRLEITDPNLVHLKHGTKSARVHGCNGPLCARAMRDALRESRRNRAISKGTLPRPRTRPQYYLDIEPILESFQNYYNPNINKEQTKPEFVGFFLDSF